MQSLTLYAALAVLTLAGCAAQPPEADPRGTVLTRPMLDRATSPVLFAAQPDESLFATLAPVASNGNVVTWQTRDDIALSLRGGVLVATRGFGHDTMSADVDGTLAALASGSGAYYPRFQTTLDGNSQIVYRGFQCRITERRAEAIVIVDRAQATTRTEEVCISPELPAVTNTYWRGSDGLMWKSRQWVGTGTGYIETERLVR